MYIQDTCWAENVKLSPPFSEIVLLSLYEHKHLHALPNLLLYYERGFGDMERLEKHASYWRANQNVYPREAATFFPYSNLLLRHPPNTRKYQAGYL